jgi:hypothetical protein
MEELTPGLNILMGSSSYSEQGQVPLQCDPWDLSQQFSSDNEWCSKSALVLDDDHNLEHPADYGGTRLAASAVPRGHPFILCV